MTAIADKNRAGLMGPEHAKTLAKAVTTDGAQTITGVKEIVAGTSTANAEFMRWKPSDHGTGKPYAYIKKMLTANLWTIGLWDGVDNSGQIDFGAATLSQNGVLLATVGGPVFTLPPRLPSYTVATLPSAATYVRGLIYVSDGTSNKRLAISDGTNWRWPDGAIVS